MDPSKEKVHRMESHGGAWEKGCGSRYEKNMHFREVYERRQRRRGKRGEVHVESRIRGGAQLKERGMEEREVEVRGVDVRERCRAR